ncbi:MAG: anthranilate phosphoribosyltransferase [Candidatus Fonsibacter sp.]|nr:anthranilate phosphoribosyltransferase [Candidatus Fonsibacter sp.]
MILKNLITKLILNKDLSKLELKFLFNKIINAEINDNLISAILTLITRNGFNFKSILSAAKILRKKLIKVKVPKNSIDTCGTGGDGKHTLNISTAAAIVLAGLGVNVVKHGNRSITSKCGSADVLEKLGINILDNKKNLEKKIKENNFIFLFAPNYHLAMKNLALVRKNLPFKTIFNLLGPLINPGLVKRQMIGIFDKNLLIPYINVLKSLGHKKAWVFHSNEGLDEISIFSKTRVYELNKKKIKTFVINPKSLIKNKYNFKSILGKDASYNSKKIIEIFNGKHNGFLEIVALNAAAGLIISGKENNLQEAYYKAKHYLLSGNAIKKIEQLTK